MFPFPSRPKRLAFPMKAEEGLIMGNNPIFNEFCEFLALLRGATYADDWLSGPTRVSRDWPQRLGC